MAGWWFGTFFIFPCIGNNHPNWLIFFRGVQTTNQMGLWLSRYLSLSLSIYLFAVCVDVVWHRKAPLRAGTGGFAPSWQCSTLSVAWLGRQGGWDRWQFCQFWLMKPVTTLGFYSLLFMKTPTTEFWWNAWISKLSLLMPRKFDLRMPKNPAKIVTQSWFIYFNPQYTPL